jgi:diguanylate cyclase (GGDEF)-like protein/PAS domain S-box-containing protein
MTYLAQDDLFLKTLTVLYVEDDPDVRQQLEQFLQRRVGELIIAGNGAEGLKTFRGSWPQIVITDIKMPGMDGLSMAQEIRRLDRNVPIIVTTAFEQTDYLLRSIEIGVDEYVTKPVNTDRLYDGLVACAYRLRLERQLKLAAAVFDHCLEAIMITDADNRIVSANRVFCQITGYSAEEVVGENPNLLSSGLQDKAFYHAMWREIQEKGAWQGEISNKRKNGSVYPEWLAITTLADGNGRITNHIGMFSDISKRKAAELHIRQLAMHDPLTGLPNRYLLKARFELALATALRNGEYLALLYVDLDNFKSINDTLGHHAGDLVLQEVSHRLQGLFRSSDTVSRLGGDEFLVVINAVDSTADARCTARKVLDTLGEEMVICGRSLVVTPSIGIAVYPLDGADLETLIGRADSAMYRAKRQGKNNFLFYLNPARTP